MIRKQVFVRDLVPPKDLAENPRAELEWRRRHIAEVTERALGAWADGEPLPQLEAAPAEQAQGDPDRVARLVGRAFRMPKETS